MKAHTNDFKNNIKTFGKEIDTKITYTQNNEEIELGGEELNSVTPHYEGAILKSVMKQLDLDSNVDIPLNTVLNAQFGVKVGNSYEYLDFGNYIVYKSEKQEDTNSYKITCYDKLLYSMVDYENIGVTYPVTIRNYINAICTYLGLTFANNNDTFANYDKQILTELYLDSNGNSLGYKFRDVLDELAQVTASTICINSNDELEIRYITQTNDTIDEDFLKDVNVNFGEKFGPVNTIVLSRSAGADNIYYPAVLPENPYEIKISDNQIMNGNNRADYLPGIYAKLNGLEYYLNDFSSPGITYYDLCDRYTVSIGENSYSCVMLNDEVNITQGLEENAHTDLPEETVTDYSKADKTDRKINETYLIVDKQNQTIESVVSNVSEQDEKISQINQTVNEINTKISDIVDITTSGESGYANVSLINVNASQPIQIKIHPIGESISYLYPHNSLYPSDTLYSKNRVLRFTNTTTSEVFEWELPTNLWYINSNTYDELELNYGDGTNPTVTVNRKCQINADGTISALATPTTESYTYPIDLVLTDGDYSIVLLGYDNGYLYVQLMASNIYTTQFATRVEMNSAITQTATNITSIVSANYVGNNEVVSKINQSAEQITINANKISLEGKTIDMTIDNIAINSTNFKVDNSGNMICNNATVNGTVNSNNGSIGGWSISSNGLSNSDGTFIENDGYSNIYNVVDLYILTAMLRGDVPWIPMPQSGTPEFERYDLNKDGVIDIRDLLILKKKTLGVE